MRFISLWNPQVVIICLSLIFRLEIKRYRYQDIHNHKTDCIDSLIIAQYDIDFLISHNVTDR